MDANKEPNAFILSWQIATCVLITLYLFYDNDLFLSDTGDMFVINGKPAVTYVSKFPNGPSWPLEHAAVHLGIFLSPVYMYIKNPHHDNLYPESVLMWI